MLNMLSRNISRGYASWKTTKELLNSRPELLAKRGKYYELYMTQFAGFAT